MPAIGLPELILLLVLLAMALLPALLVTGVAVFLFLRQKKKNTQD